MDEEAHRRQTGRADHAIVFRPDHGHELLSDIGRGIVHALEHPQNT